jgi:cytoskeletal protein CcmA (bactofilin family)
MALKSFGRGAEPGSPGTSIPTPAPSTSSNAGGLTAFIDQGSEFEGKLSFRDTVRIDGRFRGEIASENTLIVGESGEIQASIRSTTIVISGTVEGDVSAGQKVVLHKTARVTGNVETSCLVMEDGAILNGQVKMGSPDAKSGTGSLKAISGGAPPSGASEDEKD